MSKHIDEAPARGHIGPASGEPAGSSTEVKSVAAAIGHMMNSTAETVREYLSGGSGGEDDTLTTHIEYILEDNLARKIESKISKEEAEKFRLEAELAARKALKASKTREASKTGSVAGSDRPPAAKVPKVADLTSRNLRRHEEASESNRAQEGLASDSVKESRTATQ